MNQDTRITPFLMGELVAALRANDPDLFKRWLYGGIEDLGEPEVEELLLDWLDPFLTLEEQDRLLGWHLGVSFTLMRENVVSAPSFHSSRETFSDKQLLLGRALSKTTRDTSGFVSKIV